MSKKRSPGSVKKRSASAATPSKKNKHSKSAAASVDKSSGASLDPGLLTIGLLLCSTPLLLLPGLTDNFRPPKLYASELLGLLSLALLSLRLRHRGSVSWGAVLKSPILMAALPLVVVAAISGLASDHSAHVARSLPSFFIGLACWVGWTLALTADERWRLMRALTLPATLLALLVILQFHGIFDPFTFERRLTQRLTMTSLAGGAFDLAGYLMLPILVLQVWWRQSTGKLRLGLGIATAICVYGLLLTQTLTAVVASVVAICVYWAPALPRRRLIGGGLLVVTLAMLLAFASPLRPRVVSKLESLQKGEINRLLTGRLDGWRAATHLIKTNPVTGVGPGAFRAEFGNARVALIDQGVKFFRGQHRVFFVNAHNDWLEAIAEWGLLGGLALIWTTGLLWRGRRARAPGEGHVDELKRLEPAALAGMFVLASTNFPFHLALIAYPWLIFLSGLAPSRLNDGTSAEQDQDHAEETRASAKAPGTLLAVVGVVVFLGLAAVRFGNARDLLGANRLIAMVEGRSRAMVAAGARIPAQAMQQNIAMMKKAEELDPAAVEVPMALSGQYMVMKRFPAAVRSLQRAIELEPRAEPYANLARCYLAMDEKEKAFEAIDMAIKLDHNQRKAFRAILKKERRHQEWQQQRKGEGNDGEP